MSIRNRESIKELITNLFELGNNEGATEAEAQSALLKAKELMMKYNIDEEEISKKNEEVLRKLTGVYFDFEQEPWYYDLACIIARNFKCTMFMTRCMQEDESDDNIDYNKGTYIIGFYGLENDIDICILTFDFAFTHIQSQIDKIKEVDNVGDLFGTTIWSWVNPVPVEYKVNGYAVGFIHRLDMMFKEQQEQHESEWDLWY